jgi:2-dehydropantoate 2-reductase
MSEAPIREVMVIGIGGIGGVIGSRLALGLPASGRRVTFIARGPHLEAIRAAGLRLIRPDGTAVQVRPELATDSLQQAPAPDLALLCVKSYDLEQVAGRLAEVSKPETVVLPLLNGADIRERLRARLRRGIVPPACIYISARRREPGTVEHVGGAGKIHLGPDPEAPAWRGAELRAVLEQAGIPYQWHEDPAAAIWSKYLFIASLALVTAAHDADFGQVLGTPRLAAQARGVMEEIRRIAAARGVVLPADIAESTLATTGSFPPETRTSYQRDIESRAPADEGDLYGGTILRLGAAHGVATPVSAELAAAIARLRA